MQDVDTLRKWIEESSYIVFFGGAGVSTESSIPDFRSTDGLYNQEYDYPPETILSHSFYLKKPEEFYRFYRNKMLFPDAEPNRAHLALAKLEQQGKLKAVITQNIDGLHQKAGSREVLELHGSVLRNHCMRCGKFYSLEDVLASSGDLLYSLMLESHNDSAVAVAEHIGGSVEGFAGMMNQKARDIGCRDTFFVTPNGLDGEGENGNIHSTTAADLALIMRYCVYQSPKREEFLAITRTQSRTVADETGKRSFYLANHNALLSMMPEALSGKTGFTAGAGYCYVAALEDGNKAFAVALLGCGWPPHKTYKWEDMRVLANYAFNSYEMCEIFERGKEFPRIPVKNGRQDSVSLSLNLDREEQTLKVLLKEGEKPVIRYEYPKELEAPVEKGMAVGSVFYSVGGKQVAVYPIYTAEETEKADYLWYFRICLDAFAV